MITNSKHLMNALAGLMCIAALSACGKPEAKTAASTLPTGDAAAGATAYSTVGCNGCHGASAAGGSATSIRNKASSVVESAVRSGRSGMPTYSTSTVTDQNLADIIAYLNSF